MEMLFASRGPYGPTPEMCLLVPLLLLGPFILVLLQVRSLLRVEWTSWWLLLLMAMGTSGFGYLLWPWNHPPGGNSAFWGMWWLCSIISLFLFPGVLIREGFKRDLYRRFRKRRKRSKKPLGK